MDINRAGFKAMTLLGPSVFAAPFLRDFLGNSRKFRGSGSTEQNATYEPKTIKKRADTKLSTAILRRNLTVYKWPWNSCSVLKSLFFEWAAQQWSAPGTKITSVQFC